jgi:exosortase B
MSTVLEQRSLPQAEPARWRPWIAIAAGLLLLYVPTYVGFAHGIWRDDAYAHGPIVLAVFAWLMWRSRAALLEDTGERSPVLGGALVAVGLALYVAGRSQSLPLFEAASHLPVIAGTLFAMRGWPAVRRLAFALLFLVFLVPLPGFILEAATGPLKVLVSACVESLLRLLGYPVLREGVVLQVENHQMLVADACSGLNSLYALVALALLYVHLTGPSRRARLPLVLLGLVPIAIVANVVRVMALVLVTYYWGDEAAQGLLHGVAGMLVFAIALLLLLGYDRMVRAMLGDAPRAGPRPMFLDLGSPPQPVSSTFWPAMLLAVAFTGAAVAAPMMKPLPADTSAVNLERMLPTDFAGWHVDTSVAPVAATPDVQANLDRIYNQVVSRTYVNDAGEQMMLTVAYGGDQSDALKAHRQEACYKAQGFEIQGLEQGRMSIAGRDIPVTRMHAIRPDRSEPVTYWLTMGDQVVMGRLARLETQLASGLRGRMPDGMLVRVSSISADPQAAYAAQQAFIAAAVGAMTPEAAVHVVGAR